MTSLTGFLDIKRLAVGIHQPWKRDTSSLLRKGGGKYQKFAFDEEPLQKPAAVPQETDTEHKACHLTLTLVNQSESESDKLNKHRRV